MTNVPPEHAVQREISVLLIEDDDDHAALITSYFRAANKLRGRLQRVNGLAEGRAHLRAPWPDVLLLDLGLADSQGLDTLRRLMALAPTSAVVVLTALEEEIELGAQALRMGAQDYLVKSQLSPVMLERSIGYARERSALVSELKVANNRLTEFAAAAAHDLSAPLRHISAYIDLVKRDMKDQLPPHVAKDLSQVATSARKLHSLVNGLLALARSGSAVSDRRPTAVRELVAEAVQRLQADIAQQGATVHLPQGEEAVEVDADLIVAALQNLIGNAIKYVDGVAPEVHIGTERAGGELIISVRDNGIGIAPEHQERIFAPLGRLHSESEYAGSGIGLATCRNIVAAHGGRVWVESAPGEGSRFYIALPTTSA